MARQSSRLKIEETAINSMERWRRYACWWMIQRFVYFTTTFLTWNERKFNEKRINNFIFALSLFRFALLRFSTSFSVKTFCLFFFWLIAASPRLRFSEENILFTCFGLRLICVFLHPFGLQLSSANDYLWPNKPFAMTIPIQCNAIYVYSMFVLRLKLVIPNIYCASIASAYYSMCALCALRFVLVFGF